MDYTLDNSNVINVKFAEIDNCIVVVEDNVLVLPKYYNLEYLGQISLICATNSKMIQEKKKPLQSLHILYTHTHTQTHTHSLTHTGIHGGERRNVATC